LTHTTTTTHTQVWTEEDWNEDSTLENAPYRLSKTLAERATWKFVSEG